MERTNKKLAENILTLINRYILATKKKYINLARGAVHKYLHTEQFYNFSRNIINGQTLQWPTQNLSTFFSV